MSGIAARTAKTSRLILKHEMANLAVVRLELAIAEKAASGGSEEEINILSTKLAFERRKKEECRIAVNRSLGWDE